MRVLPIEEAKMQRGAAEMRYVPENEREVFAPELGQLTADWSKLECKYREPLPTKKDKTLVEILERLKGLEGALRELDEKVDNLEVRGALPPSIYAPIHSQTTQMLSLDSGRSSSWSSSNPPFPGQTSTSFPIREVQYDSSTNKMLSWPCMQQLLESTSRKDAQLDTPIWGKDGAAAILGHQETKMPSTLDPYDNPMSSTLSWETMQDLTKAYFNTFNLMYPILDRHFFQSEILPAISSRGFDESSTSTLACLVFALGHIAIDGTRGAPIPTESRARGIKGGTLRHPPGLALFNEARKRMGFSLAQCSLENVQMFSLAALYHEACCHHVEFWRMTISASLACQALLTSNPKELTTHRGDLVRRAFWHCSLMETCIRNEVTHVQEHFASQIVLRRLCVEFHTTLSSAFSSNVVRPSVPPRLETPVTSAAAVPKLLAAQLDQWRGLLPVYLRWHEDNAEGPSRLGPALFDQPMYPPVMDPDTNITFTADLDANPVDYPYASDIQTAGLRTKYYYAKYLVYRPFIFKALHHPEQMTNDDAGAAAECLKAIVKWPITMSPICFRKRLVPCLFFWTQNVLGVLLLLHLSQQVPILLRIRATLMGDAFDQDARETIILCLDWIRDLKDIDASAMRCWTILKGIYPLEDDE
ncbi:hypothetical protein GGR56DRAFT_336009 [Xylariaceae sp. FL0804]|nr:hypothetical protein GGR56DRAFT_336009 [Xylariaceae sp. FL0804]